MERPHTYSTGGRQQAHAQVQAQQYAHKHTILCDGQQGGGGPTFQPCSRFKYSGSDIFLVWETWPPAVLSWVPVSLCGAVPDVPEATHTKDCEHGASQELFPFGQSVSECKSNIVALINTHSVVP